MNSNNPSTDSTNTVVDRHVGTVPPPPASTPFVAGGAPAPARRGFSWQRLGGRFLVISVLAHLLFGAGAAYLVVQTIQAKRKLTFQSGPKGPTASTRALEHQVQVKKQKSALSAPPQARRVTTTGLAKVALPDMPAMPSMSAALSPGAISGMGAAGLAPGAVGGGAGGMGGNGAGIMQTVFGNHEVGLGLTGTFYDLKQDRNRKPTGMTPEKCLEVAKQYVRGGFNDGILAPYFKGPRSLYASQVFTPVIPADTAPTAFGLGGIVQPRMWAVHYSGKVVAPETGTFRFVGMGDDFLAVRFNGRIVLDRGAFSLSTWQPKKTYHYKYNTEPWYPVSGHAVGDDMQVVAGSTYSVDVFIGEVPGGFSQYQLLVEKEGAEYKKDSEGNPILPIFKLAQTKLPSIPDGKAPPFTEDGPVWKQAVEKAATSAFDSIR